MEKCNAHTHTLTHKHTPKSAPKMRCPIHADRSMEITFNYNIGNSKRYPHIYILMMAYPYLISIIFLSKVMRIISDLIFLVVIMPESVFEWISVVSTTAFFSLPLHLSLFIFFCSHSIPEQFVCSFVYSFVGWLVRLLTRLDGWLVGLFVIFYFEAREIILNSDEEKNFFT